MSQDQQSGEMLAPEDMGVYGIEIGTSSFEDENGVRYSLERDSTTSRLHITLPPGAAYVFDTSDFKLGHHGDVNVKSNIEGQARRVNPLSQWRLGASEESFSHNIIENKSKEPQTVVLESSNPIFAVDTGKVPAQSVQGLLGGYAGGSKTLTKGDTKRDAPRPTHRTKGIGILSRVFETWTGTEGRQQRIEATEGHTNMTFFSVKGATGNLIFETIAPGKKTHLPRGEEAGLVLQSGDMKRGMGKSIRQKTSNVFNRMVGNKTDYSLRRLSLKNDGDQPGFIIRSSDPLPQLAPRVDPAKVKVEQADPQQGMQQQIPVPQIPTGVGS